MPLFEVDAQRPLLVQSGRPSAAREPGVGTSAHQVVETHIDGLLGEQIFPVAPGRGPDEPHMLALDATGSPVVVELVAELDEAALTRALDHAGAAGRMTRGELAGRYHGGSSAFQRDIATFYDSVPVTRSQPGRSGARLIVICQEASDDILNAVDFLRQPSMPVEVLKMGVVHTADGRRFVDVSPLVVHPASDPGAPRLSSADPERPAPERPSVERTFRRAVPPPDVEPEVFAEGVAVGLALTGRMPAVVQAPRGSSAEATSRNPVRESGAPSRPEPLRTTRSGTDRSSSVGTGLPLPGMPAPVSEPEPVRSRDTSFDEPAAPPSRRRSRTERFSERETTPPWQEPVGLPDRPSLDETFASVSAPAFDLPAEPRWEPPSYESPERSSFGYDPLTDPLPDDGTYRPPTYRTVPDDDLSGGFRHTDLHTSAETGLDTGYGDTYGNTYGSAPSYEPEPWTTPTTAVPMPVDEEVDPDLIALASSIGHAVTIVWSRPRRRQYYEATLHPDGLIELPDGGRYRHPDIAASIASGSPTADGWSVWRIGHDGPTLTEAFRNRFA